MSNQSNDFERQHLPVPGVTVPNSVRSSKGFYISYNPSPADYGTSTTALVLLDTVFLILKGDHRKQMPETLQECFDYFLDNFELTHEMGDVKAVVMGCETFPFIQQRALESLGAINIAALAKRYHEKE